MFYTIIKLLLLKGGYMASKHNLKNVDLAANFFSDSVSEEKEVPKTVQSKKDITAIINKEKNKGGRPKSPNKKKQYTLTMRPDLYERLCEKAAYKQTSFSQLITDAALEYLEKN